IVLIEKSENKEFNNWLISKGIFDTFIDGQCTFDNIYEALCREQKVIVKKEVRVEKEIVEKEKIVVKKQVIKEQVPVILFRYDYRTDIWLAVNPPSEAYFQKLSRYVEPEEIKEFKQNFEAYRAGDGIE
ncbi:MAG: hypothetical protein QHH06_15430, partial [Clostridiales bacterium]|nr:hypothetical protein [Clostridiales bacterium]